MSRVIHTRIVVHTAMPQQKGVALLTAMVFLVALTLLGIGVFNSTTSEEKMARNFRDKEIAMQAAEAAMNEAKMLISGSYDSASPPATLPKAFSSETCTSGTPPSAYACFESIDPNTVDLYSGSTTGSPVGQFGTTHSPEIVGLYGSSQPRYLILPLTADKCDRSRTGKSAAGSPYCFQIIAQSHGRLGTTRVNLVELFTN